MRFLKRINEGWSDDYVTDFSDNGFTIEETPSNIKGSISKGKFLVTDLNNWFTEMTDKLSDNYKVLSTKTFFNQTTGNDYIGHLRYLKKYNIKESVESEDHYKDLADKLFYDVNEYFVEERGRFLPIKVMLSKNSSALRVARLGVYDGSLCLGPGWGRRMDEDEEDWLFDLVRSYQKEHGIHFGICANSFDHNTFYERTNNAWDDGQNFNNLPDYPFPERL